MMKTSTLLLLIATALAVADGHKKCYTPEMTLGLVEKAMCSKCSTTSSHKEKTPLVGFSFRLRRTFTSKSRGDIIPFNSIDTNAGDSFHNGVFKCPVTGMYYFAWTTMTYPNRMADTELRVDGHIKRFCNNNNHHNRGVSSTGCSIVLLLNKGNRVYITAHQSNGYIHDTWSNFQGWLIRAI